MNQLKSGIIATLIVILYSVICFTCLPAEVKEVKTGIASWYSEKSCKREGTSGVWTASGERFNEMDMTCAMRTRKWNQKWKVCNTANGKCVIVRNNDFGPNKTLSDQGRIIDLSKGAFKAITPLLSRGLINVTVEKL